MKLSSDFVFVCIFVGAFLTLQPFMMILTAFMWFVWEDAKWTAFDAENYDQKIMQGPLKPWNKGI